MFYTSRALLFPTGIDAFLSQTQRQVIYRTFANPAYCSSESTASEQSHFAERRTRQSHHRSRQWQ